MSKIIPERIREARESVGMTDDQFADAIGVSRQSVGAYETGAVSPRGDVFSKIITVTHQPPAFFTTARKYNAGRFLTPTWRSLKRMQRPDRLRIGRRLEWAYCIAEFMAEYVDLPQVNLPPIEFDYERDGNERIEEIADQVREFWNVGFGPITDLSPLLEYNGVIVVEEPVNCDDMDAVSRWQGGRPYMLYAADQASNSRKLFNLAHELAHLVLHNAIEVNSRNLDRMENQANRFAGAFLMPRRTFAREIANTTIDYFLSLKGRWRVAVAAMIYRCKELGILNPDQVKYLWKQMNARGIRRKEPLDNAFALSKPMVLASATQMLIDNKIKLPAQIAEDLVMNADDIESICALTPGTLQNKVVELKFTKRAQGT
jgi:Zn-dependent peptidase ImmA (M78 family)/transcriptional regulator with XRE-family HTH domain